jgi:hypothetical protein
VAVDAFSQTLGGWSVAATARRSIRVVSIRERSTSSRFASL